MSDSILDLAQRRPVWEAISTLFLDTDVSLLRQYRAGTLAASGYTLAELDDILIYEVYPVCSANLFSIAGEWAGFDPDWLETRIRRQLSSPWWRFRGVSLYRFIAPRSREWRRTKALARAIRDGGPVEGGMPLPRT